MSAQKINQEGCLERIQRFLFDTGLSVPQLVKKTKLTETTLRRTINGNDGISLKTVNLIAAFAAKDYKVPPEFFFVGTPDDADEEFKARLWALAREIPEEKRAALLDIVAAFCRAV